MLVLRNQNVVHALLSAVVFAGALAVCSAWPRPAAARNVEAGQLYLGGGLGPGIRLGHALGTSAADLLLVGTGEFVLSKRWSTVADVVVGFGGTLPVWGRVGGKGRLSDLQLAISPYAQAQFAGGGLFHVMGANLRWVGARLGVGVDYFATARTTVGAGLFANLGTTLGASPRFAGLFEVLVYGSYSVVPPPRPHRHALPHPTVPEAEPTGFLPRRAAVPELGGGAP